MSTQILEIERMNDKPEAILGRDEIEVMDPESHNMVKKVVPVILYFGRPMQDRNEYSGFLREWDNGKKGMWKRNRRFQF